MEELTLELEKREITGKAVNQLRRAGKVPAVVHDHGKPSIVVMGDYNQLHHVYLKAGKHHPVQLTAAGKNYTALIKHVTFDPKYNSITHMVFNAVKANEKTTAEVPVRIKLAEGNDATPAERAGFVVLNQLETVEIEAVPRAIPDALEFDGEVLAVEGDSVIVADLIVPKGVAVKTDPAHPLATVFAPSALQAANDAAGGTEEAPVTDGVATEEGAAAAEADKDEKEKAA